MILSLVRESLLCRIAPAVNSARCASVFSTASGNCSSLMLSTHQNAAAPVDTGSMGRYFLQVLTLASYSPSMYPSSSPSSSTCSSSSARRRSSPSEYPSSRTWMASRHGTVMRTSPGATGAVATRPRPVGVS